MISKVLSTLRKIMWATRLESARKIETKLSEVSLDEKYIA